MCGKPGDVPAAAPDAPGPRWEPRGRQSGPRTASHRRDRSAGPVPRGRTRLTAARLWGRCCPVLVVGSVPQPPIPVKPGSEETLGAGPGSRAEEQLPPRGPCGERGWARGSARPPRCPRSGSAGPPIPTSRRVEPLNSLKHFSNILNLPAGHFQSEGRPRERPARCSGLSLLWNIPAPLLASPRNYFFSV